MCGKLNLTEEEAIFVVVSSDYASDKYYLCPLNGKSYFHATSHGKGQGKVKPKHYGSNRFKFNPKRVLRELEAQREYTTKEEDMAVEDQELTKLIVAYLEELYRKDNTYKITSKMVIEKFPDYRSIPSHLSAMKKAKILTSLDEKVPDSRSAMYFALTSVLDRVTAPVLEIKKEEIPVDMTKVTVPAQPEKKPIPANPFEDVKKQLSEINQRLNGLAQGYADLANKPTPTVDFTDVLRSLDNKPNSQVIADYLGNFEDSIITRLNKLDQRLTQQPVPVDTKKLVSELTDIRDEESLVYLLRDGSITNEMLVGIHDSLLKAIEQTPTSSSSEEDYKRGLADGIKLAIQMGLKLNEN